MTSKKEPSRITIANLEREVRNLTQRCVDLVSARDEAIGRRIEMEKQRDSFFYDNKSLKERLENLQNVSEERLAEKLYSAGYISRVKEVDRLSTGEDHAVGRGSGYSTEGSGF